MTAQVQELIDKYHSKLSEGLKEVNDTVKSLNQSIERLSTARRDLNSLNYRAFMVESWVTALVHERNHPTPLEPALSPLPPGKVHVSLMNLRLAEIDEVREIAGRLVREKGG